MSGSRESQICVVRLYRAVRSGACCLTRAQMHGFATLVAKVRFITTFASLRLAHSSWSASLLARRGPCAWPGRSRSFPVRDAERRHRPCRLPHTCLRRRRDEWPAGAGATVGRGELGAGPSPPTAGTLARNAGQAARVERPPRAVGHQTAGRADLRRGRRGLSSKRPPRPPRPPWLS